MRHDRRGSALILVLLMTLAIAGLSIAAIFMSSSAGLLSAFYDKERAHRLAAEAALEMVRSRLSRDTALAIPDTGMRQLLAGAQVMDANGTPVPSVRVNAYVAVTGDTSGIALPMVTIIAASYDAAGTRHVRRLDLRRESFSRYSYFVDSFPSALSHGPETVNGRVHSNGSWRISASGNRYRDTMTVVGSVVGTGTFDVDSIVGVTKVPFPKDSTFPRLDTIAGAGNLSFAPVSGGTRGSRLEFVAYDVDGDGAVESTEGFVRVFDLATGVGGDTVRLRVSPPVQTVVSIPYVAWADSIVQNQCGAFYLRSGRWHFFPVSTHRRPYVYSIVQSTSPSSFPTVNPAMMDRMDDHDVEAVWRILQQPTARCFPAGSPYLMPAERMTNPAGVVTGGPADTVPFGVVPPAGGWPLTASNGYGGSDTTFTVRARQCRVTATGTGRCATGTLFDVGSWRLFGGTPISSAPDSVMQAIERPYLWPLRAPHNTNGRGVVSATSGKLYVSGVVAGNATLRANGSVTLVDRLTYAHDPNDASVEACRDQLGIVAVGDILVVNGMTSRVRRVYDGFLTLEDIVGTGEPRFTVHGSLMSLTGTVGVESANTTMGVNTIQPRCPDDAASSTATNGGCLAHTGGAAMRTYSARYGATANSGFRSRGTLDRCQHSTRRPAFFPVTNRYTFVRSLEVDASLANTPAKIRALLMRLKGKAL